MSLGALPQCEVPFPCPPAPPTRPGPSDPGRWRPQLLGLIQAQVMFATLAHLPVLLRDLLPEHSQLLHARLEGLPASTASTAQQVHGPIHVVLNQTSLGVLITIVCRERTGRPAQGAVSRVTSPPASV